MTRTLPGPGLLALSILFSSLPSRAVEADGEMRALMREAFPGWTATQTRTITAPGPDGQRARVTVTPKLVLLLDDDHRALVVSGVRVVEGDQPIVSHAAPANLGVYVFERRDDHWVQTHATPSAGWSGYFGDLGQLQRVDLGAGQVGLALQKGECWQGFCGEWLTLYAITPDSTRRVLHLMTASESLAAKDGCSDWLKGTLHTVPEHADPTLCFDISSHWQLTTAPNEAQADLIVKFTGRDATVDVRTGKPSVTRVDETLVLRQQGARYEVVSGRNPTHTF